MSTYLRLLTFRLKRYSGSKSFPSVSTMTVEVPLLHTVPPWPPGPFIRNATPDDVPLLQQLAAATWWATYHAYIDAGQLGFMFSEIYSQPSLLRQMEEEGQTFLVLHAAGGPAGFASFSVKDPAGLFYKLNKLYVQPDNQQKGLGRALLSAVEKEVRRRGGHMLDLNVNRHNPARIFYERCGYVLVEEEDIPIGPYWMNDYVMRKANLMSP